MKQMKQLKEFAKWFEVQANADANDLISKRHADKLYAIVNALEKEDTESTGKKEEFKDLTGAVHRIGFAIECATDELRTMNKYQERIIEKLEEPPQTALTLWEKIKRIFSWQKN